MMFFALGSSLNYPSQRYFTIMERISNFNILRRIILPCHYNNDNFMWNDIKRGSFTADDAGFSLCLRLATAIFEADTVNKMAMVFPDKFLRRYKALFTRYVLTYMFQSRWQNIPCKLGKHTAYMLTDGIELVSIRSVRHICLRGI